MSDLDLLRTLGDQILPPSFDALRETARRRTRRTATATTVVVAAAVAIAFGAVQLGVDEHRSAPPVHEPKVDTSRPLTYARGTSLHYGDQTVTMASEIVEIDLVDGGAVVRTDDGGIWLTDGSDPEQIGTLGAPVAAFRPELPPVYSNGVGFVVSGNTGSLAGWFEFPGQRQPELVVYDADTGEERFRQAIDVDAGSGVVLASVTDRYAYWYLDPEPLDDSPPNTRLDLATGVQTHVTPQEYAADAPPLGTPRTLLVSHHDGGGGPYTVGEAVNFIGVLHTQLGMGLEGRIVPRGMEPLEVLDGATRRPFTFTPPPGYPDPDPIPGFLTQWIDDDTIVLAYKDLEGRELSDLLVCHISSHDCEVAARSLDAVLPEIG